MREFTEPSTMEGDAAPTNDNVRTRDQAGGEMETLHSYDSL